MLYFKIFVSKNSSTSFILSLLLLSLSYLLESVGVLRSSSNSLSSSGSRYAISMKKNSNQYKTVYVYSKR